MTTTAPRIHLANLLRTSGDASASGEVTELHYEQGGLPQTITFAGPAPFQFDVNTVGNDEMWLAGRFRPTLQLECARCLVPVQQPLDLKLGTLMRYDPSVAEPHIEETDGGEELLMFGSPDLDLSAYLAELTLLGAPLSVLHDPDCKGLCQVCGTDLNVATCAHQARVPTLDPEDIAQDTDGSDLHVTQNPFAALSKLDLPDE